jgi:hypothetical protein
MEHPVWVWMIYDPELKHTVFGGRWRCERCYWSAHLAREEVHNIADGQRLGRVKWDIVDDRTQVGRTELGFMAVVTSVLPPLGDPG